VAGHPNTLRPADREYGPHARRTRPQLLPGYGSLEPLAQNAVEGDMIEIEFVAAAVGLLLIPASKVPNLGPAQAGVAGNPRGTLAVRPGERPPGPLKDFDDKVAEDENHLVPVDAKFATAGHGEAEALEKPHTHVAHGHPRDACRNNPFPSVGPGTTMRTLRLRYSRW
jgi:hypothetical protein